MNLLRATVGLKNQGRLILSSRQKRLFFCLFVNFLVIQQHSFFQAGLLVDQYYRNTLNNGTNHSSFFPLFYCHHAFPIRMVDFDDATVDSCGKLEQLVTRQANTLAVSPNVYNRSTVLLFYVDKWLTNGRLNQLSMRPALALLFTFALGMLVGAFYASGYPLLGSVFGALCACDPFQVFEVHANLFNMFSLVISVGLLAFALVLFALQRLKRPGRLASAVLVAGALGALCGLQYDMRVEGVGVFLGVMALFTFYPGIPLRRRPLALAAFLLSAFLTNSLINSYFDTTFANANALATSIGAKPAQNVETNYRTQWWAIWSGFGDYDQKYGFLVDDRAGLSYAASLYNNPDTFETTLQEDVVRTIANDPAWFAGIIGRRLYAILILNTPYRLSFGPHYVDIPVSSHFVTMLFLIGLVFTIVNRDFHLMWFSALLLSIPLVAIAQLGRYGLEFYSVVHLFILAFVVCWLIELTIVLLGTRIGLRTESR